MCSLLHSPSNLAGHLIKTNTLLCVNTTKAGMPHQTHYTLPLLNSFMGRTVLYREREGGVRDFFVRREWERERFFIGGRGEEGVIYGREKS